MAKLFAGKIDGRLLSCLRACERPGADYTIDKPRPSQVRAERPRITIFTRSTSRSATIFARVSKLPPSPAATVAAHSFLAVAIRAAAGLAIAQDDDPHAICGLGPLRHCAS